MGRGRSPGSRVIAAIRPSQGRNPSGTDGPPLAAYSCGGSSGFSPASLLAPRPKGRRENLDRRASSGRHERRAVKGHIRICLCRHTPCLGARRGGTPRVTAEHSGDVDDVCVVEVQTCRGRFCLQRQSPRRRIPMDFEASLRATQELGHRDGQRPALSQQRSFLPPAGDGKSGGRA